jgi:hypothetical protein
VRKPSESNTEMWGGTDHRHRHRQIDMQQRVRVSARAREQETETETEKQTQRDRETSMNSESNTHRELTHAQRLNRRSLPIRAKNRTQTCAVVRETTRGGEGPITPTWSHGAGSLTERYVRNTGTPPRCGAPSIRIVLSARRTHVLIIVQP